MAWREAAEAAEATRLQRQARGASDSMRDVPGRCERAGAGATWKTRVTMISLGTAME